MEMIDKPDSKKKIPLSFEIDDRSGKDVLKIDKIDLSAGKRELLKGASMSLKYGEKVCLMGKNGSGKSTLVKEILNLSDDKIKIGAQVSIGYIPQEIRFENDEATILEVSRKVFDGDETHLRSALSKFMFYGESVFKKVGNLSGGEKVRLKLFELLQKKANFLILDEPTNHIDIDTREILEDALAEYKGTLLFVSHDRYFINKLAKRIVCFENKKLVSYLGNYDDYKEHR